MLNSPFTEMEVENLNLNTEIVEDLTTGTMCEYEQVVLDSEDEEMNDRGVGKGLLNRQPKSPWEQVDANGTTFEKSTAGMCLLCTF